MIKLTFCLRRKEGLSLEEFQTYWREKHAPLVASHAETLNIKRYVQVHARDMPQNAGLAGPRHAPERYDGIAELWWESQETLDAATSTDAGIAAGRALLEDEAKFIDLEKSPLWFNEEFEIVSS